MNDTETGAILSARDDPEVRAMLAISRYLEPLDRPACARILEWARKRYTELHVLNGDVNAFTHFVNDLTEAAKQIGDVTPRDIVRLVDAVQDKKDEETAA